MPIFSFELHFDLWLKPEKFCDSKSGLGCKVVTKNWGDRNITPWKMTDNLLCGSSCTEGVYIRHLATCEWEWASTCHPSLWSVWHFYQRLMWPLLLFGGFYSPHKARHEPPVYCPNAAFLTWHHRGSSEAKYLFYVFHTKISDWLWLHRCSHCKSLTCHVLWLLHWLHFFSQKQFGCLEKWMRGLTGQQSFSCPVLSVYGGCCTAFYYLTAFIFLGAYIWAF